MENNSTILIKNVIRECLTRIGSKDQIYDEIIDSLDGRLEDLHQANLEVKQDSVPTNQRHKSSHIKVCEAVDCYQAVTESVVVSAGKFGMLTLNLCHECAVRKFGAKRVE